MSISEERLIAPAVLLIAPAVLLIAPAVLLIAPAVLLIAPAVLLIAPAVLLNRLNLSTIQRCRKQHSTRVAQINNSC